MSAFLLQPTGAPLAATMTSVTAGPLSRPSTKLLTVRLWSLCDAPAPAEITTIAAQARLNPNSFELSTDEGKRLIDALAQKEEPVFVLTGGGTDQAAGLVPGDRRCNQRLVRRVLQVGLKLFQGWNGDLAVVHQYQSFRLQPAEIARY